MEFHPGNARYRRCGLDRHNHHLFTNCPAARPARHGCFLDWHRRCDGRMDRQHRGASASESFNDWIFEFHVFLPYSRLGILDESDSFDMSFSVIVSANAEWESVKVIFQDVSTQSSPYGEYFFTDIRQHRLLFFQGGWGKVAAAGSAQYLIDHFRPSQIINLGTCGGIEGRVHRLDVVAVERAV